MPQQRLSARITTPYRWLFKGVVASLGLMISIMSTDPASAVDLGSYRAIWSDEFNGGAGARPGPHWFFFDGWGSGKWRDAHYTNKDAYLDGGGHLVLRSRVQNGKFFTSYLQTYDFKVPSSRWTTFGPGKGKYLEARINLTGLQARGPWFAFWLFDPTDTYDGNPSNGTEIDIMEYIVDGGWMTNRYNVANHWGASASRIVDAGAYGKNLRTGWHTFGLEWTPGRLTYYMDGRQVWTTTRGVSTSNGQALLLSIEYDQGPGDAWGINKNVFHDAGKLPDTVLVDYVRVYEKK